MIAPIRRVLGSILKESRYVVDLSLTKIGFRFRYHDVIVPMSSSIYISKSRKSILSGRYESCELSIIDSLLKSDDVVVEVGAGIGIVSTFIAKRLNSPRNLYCFEANPALMGSIAAVATANQIEFNVQNCAVGEGEGELMFSIGDNYLSSSGYSRPSVANQVTVRQLSISKIYSDLRPTMLVVDAEGMENDIFSVRIPEYVRAICVELHPHIIGNRNVSLLLATFVEQGFSIFLEKSEGLVVALEREGQ